MKKREANFDGQRKLDSLLDCLSNVLKLFSALYVRVISTEMKSSSLGLPSIIVFILVRKPTMSVEISVRSFKNRPGSLFMLLRTKRFAEYYLSI